MAPEPADPWLMGVMLVLTLASFATWFALAERIKHGPILEYEPRQPVPWSGVWTLLPLLFVALAVIGTLYKGEFADEPQADAADESISRLALASAQQLIFVGVFLVMAVATTYATKADLGLPKDAGELVRDVRIGAIAWLASLVPVYGSQILLVNLFGEPEGHPLLKMLQQEASPMLFVMAFMTAVVVAPICEELAFRLLLQGWLEKWEDIRLGWREKTPSDEGQMSNDDQTDPDPTLLLTGLPPVSGLFGLPYGWLPILVSSLLFALAHFGYGPDPIPLFVLALILGYCYQRTHRIVPSMVTHALFNGMSLFALWRMMHAAP